MSIESPETSAGVLLDSMPLFGKFKCILADPPWPIKWQGGKSMGLKNLEYPTMPIAEIAELPVGSLAAKDCTLLLWVTNQYLPDGLALTRLWRFNYEKLFTWCKNNGVGGRPRTATEHLLIATRGTPPRKFNRNEKALLNWIELPRGRHSEKPKEFYPIVESFTQGPRLELFARKKQAGWSAWGNEVDSDICMPNERAN
tara:strand:+ start:487 stop:1083 length:597 start_codon:yes stop_codon:yes gene_type:complete